MLLLFLLPSWLFCSPNKIQVYVGNILNQGEGKAIPMYPDIISNRTIISSRDFNCTEENFCVLQPAIKTALVGGHNLTYRDAVVQLNFIKQSFEEHTTVMYLPEDTFNYGSSLALRSNSPFLDYLYHQDQAAGFNVMFSLDSNNQFKFLSEAPSGQGLFETSFELKTNVYFTNSSLSGPSNSSANTSLVTRRLKFCLTNKLDLDSSAVYFGVPDANFSSWYSLISSNLLNATNSTIPFLRFALFSNTSARIGNFDLQYADLFANGKILVTSFSPDFDYGRKCDFYSGSLFLSKFAVTMYYVEFSASYAIFYRFSGMGLGDEVPVLETKVANEGSSWGFWLKVLLFAAVVAVIGYFGYQYIGTQREEDVYNSENQKMNEIELKADNDKSNKERDTRRE